jgi:dipeptidyl aminopeptidase/acylaminoacyl peptidase
MKRPVLLTVIVLTTAILACALQPTAAPSTPDINAIVSQTMQALTGLPQADTTPPTLAKIPDLLPRSLYFLNADAAAHLQIFRLERDGKTLTKVTAEPADVESYDVNQNDGRIVYISNNQLFLINADGSGRTILLDGGSQDVNNPFLTDIQSAVWSPNGETIAYGFGGLNLYAVDTGVTNRVLENQTRDIGNGMIFPDELYWPDRFSPDGTKLLITLGYYEGASAAVYYPAGNSLVRLTGGEGALICCGDEEWSLDGSSFFAASSSMGMFSSGLWRVDASSGQVTSLLTGDPGDGTYNFADAPFLSLDNQLYFFFANTPASEEFFMDAPLQLVRSAADGVSGRTLLLPDIFKKMNETLWSPDTSFVIVAVAQNDQTYQGGQLELVYVDGRPRVMLAPFGRDLKWGP